MISHERERNPSRSRPKENPRVPRTVQHSFNSNVDFIFDKAVQKKPQTEFSLGAWMIDQIFICSLAWMKICAVVMTTDASLVRMVDFSQIETFMVLVSIYGITLFNYQLVFMALKRPTFGQSLK